MSHTTIRTTGIVVPLLLVDGVRLPQEAHPPELRVEGDYDKVFLRFFKPNGEHLDIEFDEMILTKKFTEKASIEIGPPPRSGKHLWLGIYDEHYSSERVAEPAYLEGYLELSSDT